MAHSTDSKTSENVKQINESLSISYYDSGLPSTTGSYGTYLLFHGYVHNKRTWLPLLNTIPPAIRVIAPSLRGYQGSSAWAGIDDLSGQELQEQLGRDYVDIISWVVREIADAQHGEPQVTVLGWSLGNLGIVTSYNLLATGKLNESQQKVLNFQVEKVIFYEPPNRPVFANEQDATAKQSFAEVDELSGQARVQKLMEYLTGVLHYDSTAVEDWAPPDSRYQTEAFPINKSLCLDASFRSKYLDDVLDFGPAEIYGRMIASPADDTPAWHARAKAGTEALINAPGVKAIQALYCTTTIAECIHGSVWIYQQTKLVEDNTQKTVETDSVPSKARIDSVDAPCGHYIHVLVPDQLWEKISAE